MLNPNEACDDGTNNTDTPCDPGATSCSYCTTACEARTIEAEVTPPAGGPYWNAYLENDGADFHLASGAACNPNTAHAFSGCFHAGEVRWVTVPGVTACAGLTATDALGAFNWRCVEVQGTARMISTGLRDGMMLSDLIDFTGAAWRANSVTIASAAGPIHTTAPAVWWTNPIAVLAASSRIQTQWEIDIVRQAGDYELHVDAPNVGLVVEPGVVLGYAPDLGNNNAVLANHPFFWIEGRWAATGASNTAIHVASGHRGVIRGVRVEGFGGAAFDLRNVHGLRVEYAQAAENIDRGFFLAAVEDSLFRHLRASRNQGFGLELTNANHRNAFGYVVVSNQQYPQPRPGISIANSGNRGNVWSYVLSFNNPGDGVDSTCEACVFQNVTTAANLRDGFRPRGAGATYLRLNATANGWSGMESPGIDAQYVDIHSTLNARHGLEDMARQGSGFHGRFSAVGNSFWDTGTGNDLTCVSGNIRPCANGCPLYGVGTPGVCCNECYLPNSLAENPPPTSLGILEDTNTQSCVLDARSSDGVQALSNVDLTLDGYVGRSVDPVNPRGNYTWAGPPGSSPPDLIGDWLTFEYWFRGWGNMGCHAAPDCSAVGPCSDTLTPCLIQNAAYAGIGAGCQVWDFALIKTKADAILQQGFPTGATVYTHTWETGLDAQTCGALHPGSTFDGTRCRTTFVDHATEVVGDWIGNENFLCESGEVCVWTPFPAAYQGHGPLIPTEASPGVPYVFPDGAVTGVRLLRHENQSFDVATSP